jgi:hypothetical protein
LPSVVVAVVATAAAVPAVALRVVLAVAQTSITASVHKLAVPEPPDKVLLVDPEDLAALVVVPDKLDLHQPEEMAHYPA